MVITDEILNDERKLAEYERKEEKKFFFSMGFVLGVVLAFIMIFIYNW